MPLWGCHVWVGCHRRRAQLTSRSSMQQIGPPHAGVADKKVHGGQNFVRRRWWRFRQKVSDRPASGAQWQWWVKLGKAGKRWHGWPIQGLSRGADQTFGAHGTIVEVKRGSIKNHVGSKLQKGCQRWPAVRDYGDPICVMCLHVLVRSRGFSCFEVACILGKSCQHRKLLWHSAAGLDLESLIKTSGCAETIWRAVLKAMLTIINRFSFHPILFRIHNFLCERERGWEMWELGGGLRSTIFPLFHLFWWTFPFFLSFLQQALCNTAAAGGAGLPI